MCHIGKEQSIPAVELFLVWVHEYMSPQACTQQNTLGLEQVLKTIHVLANTEDKVHITKWYIWTSESTAKDDSPSLLDVAQALPISCSQTHIAHNFNGSISVSRTYFRTSNNISHTNSQNVANKAKKCMHQQSTNHISLIKQARCYAKSPTAQDAFQPMPGLISCAGVTRKWGLPYHAQNAVRWLTLFKNQ